MVDRKVTSDVTICLSGVSGIVSPVKHAKKLLYILAAGFASKLPVIEQKGVKAFRGYQGTTKG